ncbi:diacylglycerol/lipid kinase family protein [Hyphomonas sp.]|uniref:diacylglycerol/lipid kinase family protein n=1 Tax=Hyphomonas sp. TaxID=87 RepID=UPI00391B6F4F
MKFTAIINPAAGSVPEGAAKLLEAELQAHGHTLESVHLDLPESPEALRQRITGDTEAILIWGGDGTIAAVLCGLQGMPVPVLVLPGGTMNILPRKLHADQTDWRRVLDSVLRNPSQQWIPAGDAGGRRFYVAALFGRLTHLGGSREAIRSGNLLEAINILAREDALALDTELEISAPVAAPRGVSATAAAVMPISGPEPGFEVAAMAPENGLELAAAAFEAMLTGWRNGADFLAQGLQSISLCRDADETVAATIDGEPCDLPCPVEIDYVPRAALVLVSGDTA